MNFDDLKLAVEAMSGGKNTVAFDDLGMPSIMARKARFNLSDVISGAPTVVHPAFIVNETVVDEILISKYQNIVMNDRAYSLPFKDPRVSITWDAAKAACEAKGDGWHLMTDVEWAAIALWCKANGFQPRGNNNYGEDVEYPHEKGVPTYYSGDNIGRVATGSGPPSWAHDGTNEGIFDLNGNVWGWTHGLKIIDGIAHIMKNNNFNDSEAQWINTEVNITSGMSSGNRILTLRTGEVPNTNGMLWEGLAIPATSDSTGSPDYGNDGFWFNSEGERFPGRGGHWLYGVRAGVFALHLSTSRSYSHTSRGLRSASVPVQL